MRLTLCVGVGLLLWQAAAAVLSLSGLADPLIAGWTGPVWLAALCGVLISPPAWLGWMTATLGLILVGAGLMMAPRR